MSSASPQAGCFAGEINLNQIRALRLENEWLAATLLPDKGAGIYELIYKPRGMDVLWKSPMGLAEPGRYPSTFDSMTAWLEVYEGGWQTIFPNGGPACIYNGVELNFHGEASLARWHYEIVASPKELAEIRLSTRLRRSPFRLERTMRVETGSPVLIIRERITNEGGEPLEAMWGHHPAYGAPFLGPDCRIDIGATRLWADDLDDSPANPLSPGQFFTWPKGEREGRSVDLSQMPGEDIPRHLLAYFDGFENGWYGLTNTRLGFGVGLVWPVEVFPYAWFWQEMHASGGFPWYKNAYVMALEPFSSYPSQGLLNVKNKTATQRVWVPEEAVEAEIKLVFYESSAGIARIDPDGKVWQRNP